MPSLTKRGNSYKIMVSLGYDASGKQVRKTTTFVPPPEVTEGKGRKLAETYAHEFERHCRGMTNLGENMKFHELATWYYEEIAPNVLKDITIYSQTQLLKAYILPEIGHLKLRDIGTGRLDEFVNKLRKSGGKLSGYALINTDVIPLGQRAPIARKAGISAGLVTNLANGKNVRKDTAEKISVALEKPMKSIFRLAYEKKGLTPSTIENILGIVSAIFRTAVRKGMVEKNPAAHTTPPKRDRYAEKPYIDDNQCRRLLSVLEEHNDRQFALIIKTFLFTGLRAGELCALHWMDLELDKLTITVRHTLTRMNGVFSLNIPKTKSSGRVVNIPEELANDLKAHQAWQAEAPQLREHIGQVFTNETGGYHCRNLINAKFQRLLEKYGFDKFTTHDLRHANASVLINAGVPSKVIADHLGHGNTKTTENVYAHVYAATKAKLAGTIVNTLRGELSEGQNGNDEGKEQDGNSEQ